MIQVPEVLDPVMRSVAGTSYTLIGANVEYDIDALDAELVKSVLNGDQALLTRGEYFSGQIDYFGMSLADYVAIKALQGAIVRLWPLGTGSIGVTNPQYYYPYVDVLVTSVRPYHRDKKLYMDAMIITFTSQKYYTLVRATDNGLGGGA